ncbi:MAG: aminoacyl-tRNA hydrolase [Pseudomonadota bacterium]|nr:aminoacyl-tRNA hydrolase [Pseudomonadota bacterium]
MLVIVGLGNPGEQHARQRHNIGFMAVQVIAGRFGFSPWRRRFQAEIAEGTVEGRKVLALLPQTYMNLSGQAVGEALRFYKVPPADMIVFHDELDLVPGTVRIKKSGGHAGHNGLRSLDQHVGPDYWRVRLGIGHPGHRDRVSGYVLHDFGREEVDSWVVPLLDRLAQEFPLMAAGQPEQYAGRVTGKP